MIGSGKEWLAAGIVGAAFLFLLAVAEGWSRLGGAKPEWTRKLVHIGGGMVCLSFPWLFRSPWVVLIMALLLSALFALGARTGWLHSLHRVARKTRGSEYYPLSIFLLFVISGDRPWLFLSSVLVLAVGDAFAALIGSRYGRLRYEVENEHKSVEGSLVFLLIAFTAMSLPMVLLADMPPVTAVLAALLVAVLVTGFEAISLGGADNLFVPLGVCVILSKITTKPVPEIVYQNLSLLLICGLVSLLVKRARSFNVGGTVTFILFAYGTWSLGSELWALPVFIGFGAYMAVWFLVPVPAGHRSSVKVRTIFQAVVVPLLILVTGNMTGWESRLYGPFVASLVMVLAFSLWNHLVFFLKPVPARRHVLAAVVGGLAAGTVALLPWYLLYPGATVSALATLGGLGVAGTVVNDRLMGLTPDLSPEHIWSASRIALTAVAAAGVLGLQWAGFIPPWIR